ncbi:hypothetical protein VB636_09835 [Paracoccus sp. APAP_BH8]
MRDRGRRWLDLAELQARPRMRLAPAKASRFMVPTARYSRNFAI